MRPRCGEVGGTPGVVTVFGYGSLMDWRSAQKTMPNAGRFRPGRLEGYRRVFSLVSVYQCKSGRANWTTKEVAALAARRHRRRRASGEGGIGTEEEGIIGCLFDIPAGELPSYFKREARYRFLRAPVTELEAAGAPVTTEAWVCVEGDDASYRATFNGDDELYTTAVGQWYDGVLWGRPDILPGRPYLRACLRAARNGGCFDNFVDTTFLADGVTSIRSYIESDRDASSWLEEEEVGGAIGRTPQK